MAWIANEPGRTGQTLIETVDDVAAVPLGTIIQGRNDVTGFGAEFIYLGCDAGQGIGHFAVIEGATLKADRAVANDKGPICVAMAAGATGQFGWFAISGVVQGLTNGAVAADASLYLTATEGRVDDAVVAGDRVHGAWTAGSRADAGLVNVLLVRPCVTDIAD